jgi:DNA-binding transcriptional ArsR family regulator
MTQTSKRKRRPARKCCASVGRLFEARFFKALCDPSRVGILARLAQRRKASTVSEIAACCPTSISVVSRHLATLRDAGILHADRRGKEVYYSVCYPEVTATLRAMADAIEACCPTRESTCEERPS